MVHAVAILVPYRHALAGDGLDVPVLYNLTVLAPQPNDMAIHVGKVSCPVAKERLAEREYLPPVEIIVLATEKDAVDAVRIVLLETGILEREFDNQVASDVVGVGVSLVLVGDPGAVGHAALHRQRHRGGLSDGTLTAADRAAVLDGLAATATLIALHLDLLNHTRCDLVPNNLDTVAFATRASLDNAVSGASATAFLAYLLLVPVEFCCAADVEVSKRDGDLDGNILALSLSPAKVTAATEEAVEHVEGIVMVATATSLLLVLLQAFVAILVIDAPAIGIAECFVRLRDLDELVMGGIVAAAPPESGGWLPNKQSE